MSFDYQLYKMGREVAWKLPTTMRPTRHDFKAVAIALKISAAYAQRAWHYFVYAV